MVLKTREKGPRGPIRVVASLRFEKLLSTTPVQTYRPNKTLQSVVKVYQQNHFILTLYS